MKDEQKNKNKWIKKIAKRIIGFGIFFGILFTLNENSYIHAENENAGTTSNATETSTEDTLKKSLQETKGMLDIILKIIYMVSRPLLVIAGNAMDNSLVYGAFFHLDAPLWKFWNIMKNFANYALGFVLLYHILKSLFTWKGIGSLKDKDSPLGIIKKVLIAGIMIQASRFLLSAVIDISTIATYAVGGMPLTILKNSNLGDQRILGVNSTMNLSDSKSASKEIREDTVIYRTYGENPVHNIASCKIGSGGNSQYIVGKEINFITLSGSNSTGGIPLEMGLCVLGGVPYRFNEFPGLSTQQTNKLYDEYIESKLNLNATLSGFEECGFVIPIFSQLKYDPQNCYDSGAKLDPTTLVTTGQFGSEGGTEWLNSIAGGTTLSTLIDKSKGFVGPLITIYSSTLNFGQLVDTKSGGDSISFGIVLKFMIKAFIGIMLILPILALAVIMIARIGILWIAIAFTPIIAIDQVFEFKILEKMKFLEVGNLIKLIFAPVFIVFGLSISLIFMSTLSNILSQNKTDFSNLDIKTQKESTLEGLGITQPKPECYTILGTWTFCTKLNLGGGLDNISYLLINIFGIAIMWTLLFWAIQQSGEIGKKVGESIKKFGETTAGNMPIIPIGGGIGFNQIAGTGGSTGLLDKMSNKVTENMSNANEDKLAKALPGRGFKTLEERNGKDDESKENSTTGTIDGAQAKKIMEEIQTIEKSSNTTERETQIKEIVEKKTDQKIDGSITEWIKQPDNIKLLFAEFEKLNPNKKNNELKEGFEQTFGIKNLLEIPSIKTYQEELAQKDIGTILENLNKGQLEALVTIPMETEIELLETKGGSAKKKYKIKKNGINNYISEEFTATT